MKRPAASRSTIDALTLGAILESAAAAIVTIDSRGILHTANPAARRMFGYTKKELIGHNVSLLMQAEHARDHDSYIQRYITSGKARIVGIGREVVARRKDGSTFPIHLSVGKFESDGETYFTGVVIDLSAQKQAEQSSARQQAFFQSIFESLPDPVLIVDRDRRIELANPAFAQVFGYAAAELKGLSSDAVYASPEEWARHGRQDLGRETVGRRNGGNGDGDGTGMGNGDDIGGAKVQVMNFRRKSGENFPAATVRTAIRDAHGNVLGYLKVVRDISDELRREAALMQASRMEAIGQLTGGIAHDFNNILTVILGNVELLEMRLDDQDAIALAREAQEAAEMGARLTDRLLTFGRRQHLEVTRIDLNEFVLGLTDILNRTLGEDIDLSTALAGDLWATLADAGQVENALLNLAINARDAMPAGGRLVIETRNVKLDDAAVALIPELKPGDYVVLAVSDTGHGMPADVRARAFEPFFTTKGPGKGSGLGLATIYGFAKQSGGHATIYSEVGQGTMVELYLPRADGPSPADEAAIEAPAELPAARGETILVVEDDERVRRLTVVRLGELGYRVREARTGMEALALLANKSVAREIDLVFSDLVMPGGMSGLDLLRAARALCPDCRFLLTSGYAEELVDQGPVGAQYVRLLHKPYRQVELALAVRQTLDDDGSA